MNSEIHILHPGSHTQIKNTGRFQLSHLGIPPNGPMDERSSKLCNQVLENATDQPLLEIFGGGLQLKFTHPTRIAFTGAQVHATLQGIPLPMNQALLVQAESVIKITQPGPGRFTYLGFRGELQCPQWQNSPNPIQGMPTIKPLTQGQTLRLKNATLESPSFRAPPWSAFWEQKTLRCFPGPEFEKFNRSQIARFFSQSFQVSHKSSFIGTRLEGNSIGENSRLQILSSTVFPGVVQITPEGLPIIFLGEAPATGGYPRMAIIHPEDLPIVAQKSPGDLLHFQWIE